MHGYIDRSIANIGIIENLSLEFSDLIIVTAGFLLANACSQGWQAHWLRTKDKIRTLKKMKRIRLQNVKHLRRRESNCIDREATRRRKIHASWIPLFVLVFNVNCGKADLPDPIPDSNDPVVTVASTTQIEILDAALEQGISVVDAYAVRSETHEWGHYIAARLRGVDSSDVGLWFMQAGMDVPGDRVAINEVARRYSEIVDADVGLIESSQTDLEIQTLLALVEARRTKRYP